MSEIGCPRCGCEMAPVEVRNALSRRDNETYICAKCGQMEAIEDMNIQKISNPHNLPRFCYYNNLGRPKAKSVLLTFGLSGYLPLDPSLQNINYMELNKKIGVDFETAEAMCAGSLWGWEVPGTNPQIYREKKKVEI